NFSNPDLNVQCISIYKAFLYWAAADKEKDNGDDNQPGWNYNDVKLMLPGETDYTTLTADDVIFRGRDAHFSNEPYICFKDITDSVLALPDVYGAYQVANIEAKEGDLYTHSGGNVGTSGGWQIVFIYESLELPAKNITLFDGYAHVTASVNNFEIDFNGFQTIPTGNVSANVVFGSLEGDRDLQGDRLQIRNVANNFVDISTPMRDANNFFNSRITVANNNFVNRDPASRNTLGFDAGVFALDNPGNTIITNNQTAATLRMTSDQETYGLYLLGLAVEVWEPNLNPLPISLITGTNPTNPGDTIGVVFNVQNTGNDDAVNVTFTTILPHQVSLVPPTSLPTGVSYNYDDTTKQLSFSIEDGLVDVGDDVIDIEFDLLVNDECYFLEDNCDLSLDIQFTATYNGIINPDPQIAESSSDITSCVALPLTIDIIQPTVNWATPPFFLNASIECDNTAALAIAQGLEPEPDKCVFTLIKTSGEFVPYPNCPSSGTYTNTWNFTDACGVTIEDYVQVIEIIDTTLPTASNLPDVNVQCIEDIPGPDIEVVTDEADNCSVPSVAFVSDVSDGMTCPQTLTRTYSVTDDCGNSIEVTQNFIINDDIAPTASNPAPIILECGEAIPAVDISVVSDAADNCASPSIIHLSDVSNGQCPEIITRTFQLSDLCGNSITVAQQLIYEDTTAPTLIDPIDDNLTVNCDEIPDIPSPQFEDECSANLTVSYSETDTNDNNTIDYDIIRQWSVSDECGNIFVLTQNIHVLIANCIVSSCNSCGVVDDTIPPTASNPADLVVNCSESIPPPDPSVVTDAADNCVPPEVTFISESVSFDCFEKVTRIYRVTDECGNYIDVIHNINVIDDVLPTASNPPDIDVTCVSDVPSPDISVVTDAADNCSVPTVSFLSDVSNNGCGDRITRTYRVTDSCGNFTDVVQTINVVDDVLPTASAPENITVQCIGDVPSPDIALITDASDNCSAPTVSYISDVSDGQSCPETITRTYRVTDFCGNYIDLQQAIMINDDIAPTASNLPTENLECLEDLPEPNVNLVTDASDNCSVPEVAFVSDVSDDQSCSETITRTYSVTDDCGNTTNITQLFVINDITAPTASDLPSVELECIDELPSPDISLITDAEDNCSIPVVEFVSDVSNNESCSEIITRTYLVSDTCGNSIDVTQLFILTDDTLPTADELQDITIDCIDNLPDPDISVITNAADNCGGTTVTWINDDYDEFECNASVVRTYNVMDDCGNSIDVTRAFNIVDEIAPILISELDEEVTILCDKAPDKPELQFEDNCAGDLQVDYEETTTQLSDGQYDVYREWIVTDSCDNQSVFTQAVYVRPNIETLNQTVSLCIEDENLDLNSLLSFDNEGNMGWESISSIDMLVEGMFNPSEVSLGTYEFQHVRTENSCSITTNIILEVHDDCVDYPCIDGEANVEITKMVTPNGDGINDFFEVVYIISELSDNTCDIVTDVKIFNRWGTRVYHSNDYQNDWDGYSPGSGMGGNDYLPTGTYFYIVDLKNGGIKPIQGYIYLGSD
ncbi:MAG: gliding motility-associated C-terminal domain-containing protein, partial [Bacteroidia bacterium]|nr:gliding motility-associated C-terminal domain-containing protein [Bacteroidia bacterium]